jgi:hypothetical protein
LSNHNECKGTKASARRIFNYDAALAKEVGCLEQQLCLASEITSMIRCSRPVIFEVFFNHQREFRVMDFETWTWEYDFWAYINLHRLYCLYLNQVWHLTLEEKNMPAGTLDIMKLAGQPITYQIMFELDAGGMFVARVEPEELVPFMHEEMRVEMESAERAARLAQTEGRVRMDGFSLEENNLHAAMEYLEEDA